MALLLLYNTVHADIVPQVLARGRGGGGGGGGGDYPLFLPEFKDFLYPGEEDEDYIYIPAASKISVLTMTQDCKPTAARYMKLHGFGCFE